MTKATRTLTLSVLPEKYAVLKYAKDQIVPAWAMSGRFSSVTRTEEELSIVTALSNVPESELITLEWSMFKVHGPFAFTETGVLASLAEPLAEQKIGIFVIATFDTDYLLVNAEQLSEATNALRVAGHTVQINKFSQE